MTYIDRQEPGVTRISGGFSDPPHLRAWPVGSVFISFSTESPAVSLGGGTWVQMGQGRVLMGYDASDPTFSTIGALDGSSEVILTEANLPPHDHDAGSLGTSTDGNHSHNADRKDGVGTGTGFARGSATDVADYSVDPAGNHNHDVTGNTGSVGSGESFEILPPYVVVAMWRRTA